MNEANHWFTASALPGTTDHTGLAVGTHSEAVTLLCERGFSPVSVSDLAAQRLTLGPFHQISWTGSRTTDLLLVSNGNLLLAHSDPEGDLFQPDTAPVLEKFNADGNEVPIDHDAVGDTITIPSTNFEIPVHEVADHPITQFLLGDYAAGYQDWLADLSITHLPFMVPPMSLARHYPHPFMRPLIMRCTDNWSGIITTNADLHTAYGYRSINPNWAGEVQPPESFTATALIPLRDLFGLEFRDYTLTDLMDAAENSGHGNVLGTALRLLRGASDLPASHATWQPTHGDPA